MNVTEAHRLEHLTVQISEITNGQFIGFLRIFGEQRFAVVGGFRRIGEDHSCERQMTSSLLPVDEIRQRTNEFLCHLPLTLP